MIQVVDQFLTEKEYNIVSDLKFRSGYKLESDGYPEDDPIHNGMSLDIPKTDEIYKLLSKKISNQFQEIFGLEISRMYINCFAPSEWSFYHTDSEQYSLTFLYYLNDIWDINDGGETHFYLNDKIIAMPPIPNRLVYFDGRILHKATPFRNKHRFTIALKYL
jgi:hypothetical protein